MISLMDIMRAVCCCAWRLCSKCTTSEGTADDRHTVTPSSLESGQAFKPTQRRIELSTNALVKSNRYGKYPGLRSTTPIISNEQERPNIRLPYEFNDFIIQKIIPHFKDQRIKNYQFAVVLLLSEKDFKNINRTIFNPSNTSGKPITDNTHSSMPQNSADNGNYIVARPENDSYHSEELIFGQYSVEGSLFSRLWRAYVNNNGANPRYVLIYSWNLPCSRCTEVIIRSFREEPYNHTNVIVAHTICWKSEGDWIHERNRQKLSSKNITVKRVKYPDLLDRAE